MKYLMSLISILNLGVRNNKTLINFNLKPNYLSKFLDVLVENNFISYEKIVDNGFYEIPKHTKPGIASPRTMFKKGLIRHPKLIIFFKKNTCKGLKIISTPGRKVFVDVYTLKSLCFKNSSKAIYILSTSKYGFIDSTKALNSNVGGLLICKISF